MTMYQLTALEALPNIIHGISSTTDGNMSFVYGNWGEVMENRNEFLKKLGVSPEKCVAMTVRHGTKIVVINKSAAGRGIFNPNGIPADGLITREKGLFLFLLTADCLPILFYDPVAQACGLAHAGWKSTRGKIAAKTVAAMVSAFRSEPSNIVVGIGPGIHKESYLIPKSAVESRFTPEFREQFVAEWKEYVAITPDGNVSLDLVGYNKHQLKEAGTLEENIEISPIDTAKSPDFFSHYRAIKTGEKEGRFAIVLGIKSFL